MGKSVSKWQPKLAEDSTCAAPSPPSTRLAKVGRKPIDANLKTVLHEAWVRGFTTKSDFSREFADFVAMAASMGLITSRVMGQVFGRGWQITAKGLYALEHEYGVLIDDNQ